MNNSMVAAGSIALFVVLSVTTSAQASPILFSKAQIGNTVLVDTDSAVIEPAVENGSGVSVFSDHGSNRAWVRSNGSTTTQGTSIWRDTLTLTNGGEPVGAQFTAIFGYTITGSFTNITNDGSAVFDFFLSFDPDDQGNIGTQSTSERERLNGEGTLDIDLTGDLTFDFENGVPFDFESELFVDAFGGSGISTADFLNTVLITSVEVPAGFELFSETGTTYPVPEPATLSLTTLALLSLLAHGHRRCRA